MTFLADSMTKVLEYEERLSKQGCLLPRGTRRTAAITVDQITALHLRKFGNALIPCRTFFCYDTVQYVSRATSQPELIGAGSTRSTGCQQEVRSRSTGMHLVGHYSGA